MAGNSKLALGWFYMMRVSSAPIISAISPLSFSASASNRAISADRFGEIGPTSLKRRLRTG
jgi:hypothetical protein